MRLLFSITLVATCLAAAPVLAQPRTPSPEDDARARERFESGRRHYDAGELQPALDDFEAAYRLSGRPLLLYNIYLAHLDLGHAREALDALRRYLTSDVDIAPDERRVLEQRQHALEEQLRGSGGETGHPTTDGHATDTHHDGAAAGTGEPGHPGGGRGPTDQPSGGGIPTLTWVSWGVAVAAVAVEAVTGVMALGRQSDLEQACPDPSMCSAGNPDDADTGRTLALVSDISLGVAIAGAAVGTIVWIVDSGHEQRRARSVTRRGRARIETRVAPAFGPHHVGLGAELRF